MLNKNKLYDLIKLLRIQKEIFEIFTEFLKCFEKKFKFMLLNYFL